MKFRRIAFSLTALLWAVLPCAHAIAQQTVLQGGNWTGGDLPVYAPGSSSSYPVIVDSGAPPAVINIGATNQIPYYATAGITLSPNPYISVNGGALVLGVPAHLGSIQLNGSISGTVSLFPQTIAGTFNFNFPITAGTSGGPLLSGGGGTNPMTWGTVSGIASEFATVTGSLTPGDCLVVAATGDIEDNGQGCGGSGTVNTGSAGQFGYYASSTNAISGSTALSVSGSTISTIGALDVGTNLVAAGTLASGANSGTLGRVILNGSSSGTISLTPQAAAGTYNWNFPITAGTSGYPLLSGGGGGGAMTWGTLSGNTSEFATASGSLTSGHVAAFDSSGNIVDGGAPPTGTVQSGTGTQLAWYAGSGTTISGNGNATVSGGALTMGVTGSTAGSLVLSGSSTGAVTVKGSSTTVGTYNFNLPVTAGTSGQPMLSGGGTTNAMTWGTLSGTTTKFGTVTGALVNGDCVAADASGNLVDNGSACGSGGSGTVTSSTAGQIAYYAASNNAVAGNSSLTISGGAVTIGVTGTTAGTLGLSGSSTGKVTIQGSTTTVGTYNFNLPTTAGTAGQVLASAGGGSSAMTWVSPGVSWGGAPQTGNFNATANTNYCANLTSTAITVTLPTTPPDGTTVGVTDCYGKAATNNLTFTAGGADSIMVSLTSLVDGNAWMPITLVYSTTQTNWSLAP